MINSVRNFGIFMVPALVVTALITCGPAFADAECVWQPPNRDAVGAAVASWSGRVAGSSARPEWSLSADGGTVALKIGEAGAVAIVRVLLSPDCSRTVKTTWLDGARPWFSDGDAADLVAGLGLSTVRPASGRSAAERSPTAVPGRLAGLQWYDFVLTILALGALVLAFCRRRAGRLSFAVDTVILAGMMLMAAWPIFPVPFSSDAQILRVAFAARDIFADWNHPFLSYLLNRPAALFSSDPVILRMAPFAWALVEALLYSLAARRLAGRAAAMIVAVWMALSLRLSMGMIDLSDWNLGGIFLALMSLWLIELPGRDPGWKRILFPALLITAGCFSSYMMLVPSAVLVVILLVERVRGRVPPVQAATSALALIIAGSMVFEVFSMGSSGPRPGAVHDLPWMMRAIFLQEPPFGLGIAIPILCVGGLFTGSFRRSRALWLFCLATLVASVAALAFAATFSSVNGAYYFGLGKGLFFLPAAVLAANALEGAAKLADSRGPRLGPGFAAVSAAAVPFVMAAAVFFATFGINGSAKFTEVDGIDRLGDFVEMTGRGERRVFSNDFNAPVLLLYSDVLAGRSDIGVLLEERDRHRDTWVDRTVFRFGSGGIDCGRLPGRFLVFWRDYGRVATPETCGLPDPVRCTELFIGPDGRSCADAQRAFCYYECRGTAESPGGGETE